MKFLADMGISLKTVAHLQALGFDAAHLHPQGLDRLSDSQILEKAKLEGRVLLTHDLDFPNLLAASGGKLPSVIVFRLRSMRPESVNRHLDEALRQGQEVLEQGCIMSVMESQVRIRRLPLRSSD